MIALLLAGSAALAARPDASSGAYSYAEDDVLATLDGAAGLVRVTYSVEGSNQVKMTDSDEDGVPDFAQLVVDTAEDVLLFYADQGYRAPLPESEFGLDDLGGSPAFDIYLVDFAGVADGWFATDACRAQRCSGYVAMENDFRGYGYPSLDEAVAVLTSHELFHAVQAAYNAEQPGWVAEGTAGWAEHLYDPTVDDFLWFCDAYLSETTRSLDRPPSGNATWLYATSLFWAYLAEQQGDPVGVALQEALVGLDEDEALDAVEAVIEADGFTLEETWDSFAAWNLATGDRAGATDSYPFAEELSGVLATQEGAAISDDNRFYPLATTYYRLDHAGGPLYFATLEDPTGLHFALHPVAGGEADGPVQAAVATLAPDAPGRFDLGELPAGGYWLVGAFPARAENSVKIAFCLGDEAATEPCTPAEDTGGADDTGDPADTGEPGKGGCACASGGAPYRGLWGLLPAGVALFWRRRGYSYS